MARFWPIQWQLACLCRKVEIDIPKFPRPTLHSSIRAAKTFLHDQGRETRKLVSDRSIYMSPWETAPSCKTTIKTTFPASVPKIGQKWVRGAKLVRTDAVARRMAELEIIAGCGLGKENDSIAGLLA